jgi:ABC-2 type transport system permease protein
VSSFTRTGSLVRLGLRLDRVRLVIWIVVIPVITYATAAAFRELYPTEESRLAVSLTLANAPALVALTGPPFDLRTIGGLTAWRTGGLGPVLLAMMGFLTVNRHTRAEEEAGRLELIGSGSVGRFAPLAAALSAAFGASLIVGALVCLSLVALGESVSGSIALGMAFAGAGAMFASVAAAAAQLTAGARAAGAMAGSLIGVSFLLRAIGDSSGPEWLSWLSPIGWAQQVRPFAGERWWVFGLMAGFCVVFVAASFALLTRRDLGSGLLPAGPGPASAPDLDSAVKLAWRLHRSVIGGWVIALAMMGATFGTIAESIGSLLEDNPQLKEIFEAMAGELDLTDAFFASIMGVVGLLAGAYAIQATLRIRSEEVNLRAEPVLATKVTRIGWVAGHLVFAVLGSCLLTVAAGVGAGLVHGLRTSSVSGSLTKLIAGGAVQLPAVFVLVGLTLLLIGFVPRWSAAAWGVLVVSLVLKQLGPILQLDQVVLDLSPFTHVPQIPGQPIGWAPLLILTAVATAMSAVGALGFRNRDIG